MKRISLVFFLLLIASVAFAADKPSLEEIQKVVNFYYTGQGQGAFLVSGKLCEDTYKEGDEKYNCKNEIVDAELRLKQKAIIWMHFFGPEGDKFNILVQFNRKGITRHTTPLTINGSFRYRANATLMTGTAGDWTVNIYHDGESDVELLGTFKYHVSETE